MFRRFAQQVLQRRFSSGDGNKITWVSINWYGFKGGKLVVPFVVADVPTLSRLQKEIGLRADVQVGAERVRVSYKSHVLEIVEPTPVAEENSPLKVTIEPTDDEKAAIRRGERFVNALWDSTPQVVSPDKEFLEKYENPKIKVMRSIPSLDYGEEGCGEDEDIILRFDTEKFWDDAIGLCGSKKPVCVVGSPGIGKSTSMVVALKRALENGHPVTYLVRSSGFYFQFVPQGDGVPQVRVYPEWVPVAVVPTMNTTNAFLFVDPAKTKTTCDWSSQISARLLINASPDERHWGGSEFQKFRTHGGFSHGGTFRYYRGYSLEELLVARPYINKGIPEEEVAKRFFEFGGSVRNVFGPLWTTEDARVKRERDFKRLSQEQAFHILYGESNINHMSPDAHSSTLLDLVPSADYRTYTSPAQSQVVQLELLRRVDIQSYIAVMSSLAAGGRPLQTELLLARLLCRPRRLKFRTRPCVGKSSSSYQEIQGEELGGCTGYDYLVKIAEGIEEVPEKTLLLSYHHNHPLFDMMYRDGNVYHVFNATKSSKKKKVNEGLIEKLASDLKLADRDCEVRLYYSTIGDFEEFTTDPVAPEVPNQCFKLFHLDIGSGINSAKPLSPKDRIEAE